MRKRRPSLSDSQMVFTFDAPKPASRENDLAGLAAMTASAMSRAMREDSRSRAEIAGHVSALLGEPVSSMMLDSYASEARAQHNPPFHRTLALIAATGRFDILDALVREIGAALLVGEEIHTAELGHIDRTIAELRRQRRQIASLAKPIGRNGR